MIYFNELIEFSKKLSKAILNSVDINTPEFLDESDKNDITQKLNQHSYWEKRNNILSQIDVDNDWKRIEEKILVPKIKRFRFAKYAVAAVFVIGLISLFVINQQTKQYPTQIVSGSDKAILILENGEKIELAKGVQYSNANAALVNNQLQYDKAKETQSTGVNILNIPRGGQFVVQLSDGTKVWLNSETQLKYPVKFISGKPRVIELVYGEAYFDVSHSTENDGDAFRVVSQNQTIEVLGTEFNIRMYPDENNIYTTLSTGSINISSRDNSQIIKPGEQAIVSNVDFDMHVKKIDVAYETAWKNGLFMFEKEPLKEMMTELSRWYDVEVVFEDPKKENYIFSGLLNRADNIGELLENLEKTKEVEFEIIDKKIYIK